MIPTDGVVDRPKHYGGTECIEAIERALGTEAVVSFCLGNSMKYIWRNGLKDPAKTLEDLKKAAVVPHLCHRSARTMTGLHLHPMDALLYSVHPSQRMFASCASPVWIEPSVTLLSRPSNEPPLMGGIRFMGEAEPSERLAEFAGRVCYMSQANRSEKTTAQYLGNILAQGHGSVLEHINVSVLIQGVSRSLSHELVRHRAGFAYSQLSQRYVGPEHLSFVVPPLVLSLYQRRNEDETYRAGNTRLFVDTLTVFEQARTNYLAAIETLEALVHRGEMSKPDFRKAVQQTARNVLPNATETKLVVTGNARAWRHVLELRGKAEPEIRRLAVELLRALRPVAPAVFSDFSEVPAATHADGFPLALECEHHKV